AGDCVTQLLVVDTRPPELSHSRSQGFGRDPALVLVLASPADAVMLLRDVRQLEEQCERAQDVAPCGGGQLADRPRQRRRRAGSASHAPRKQADALDELEQLGALLLDEHATEQLTKLAHVRAEGALTACPTDRPHAAILAASGNRVRTP